MILVLIAAYNEEATLPGVLAGLPRFVAGHRVRTVVLSDGSTDATAACARDHGAQVVEFPENRGKGSALKVGLGTLIDDECSAVVLMDGDGQHDPAMFPAMASPVLDGTADIVIGSRYLGEQGRGNTPRNRYVVRWAVRGFLHRVLSARITDPFSGYRALTPHAADCVELTGDRYESELEMLFCAESNSLRVVEIPIPKLYGASTSKMGARYGAVMGRADVLMQYMRTLVRETYRLRVKSASSNRDTVSA